MSASVDQLLTSVAVVRSRAGDNGKFGTAYVVKHDPEATYLVTCAHVVRDVGGDACVQVEGGAARVVACGSPHGADDVAVLATRRLAAPVLRVTFAAERGRRVVVVGFRPIQSRSGLLGGSPVEATLGTPMVLEGPDRRTRAWQLRFEQGGLVEGYSGSPIVDAGTGEVIATAAYREGDERAIAIDTDVLRSLWPDGMRDLALGRSTYRGVEFVYVPASRFIMGTPERRAKELAESEEREIFQHEAPAHAVELLGYHISRFPITNRQYAQFVQATNHRVPIARDPLSRPYSWNPATRTYPEGQEDYPVVLVSWHDARAYCAWLGVRLPTEAEWEKAARGTDGRTWPWGDTWEPGRCNTLEAGYEACLPVGRFSPAGDSPFGVADMVGNVWQWCHSVFDAYPYSAADGREWPSATAQRVMRGGAWGNNRWRARCAARNPNWADDLGFSIGFRVALSAEAIGLVTG